MPNGFFLGGAADGMQSARLLKIEQQKQVLAERREANDLNLRNRQLANEEARTKADSNKQLLERVDKSEGDLMKTIIESAKAARDGGATPEQIENLVLPLAKGITDLHSMTGRDPRLALDRIGVVIRTPAAPETELGKLQVDYGRGLIDEPTYTGRVSKLTTPASGPSIVEVIRRKLAAGEALSDGERGVYDDALKANPLARLLSNPQGGPQMPAADSQLPSPRSEAPPVAGARKATDGQWYVPDPDRPGKYLRVAP